MIILSNSDRLIEHLQALLKPPDDNPLEIKMGLTSPASEAKPLRNSKVLKKDKEE